MLSSILITQTTTQIVRDSDNIMIELKKNYTKYEKLSENAIINGNTIIPGQYGRKVNINKSYKEMKKIGIFNEKYIIYDEIKPEISIEKQYDKYIIKGNENSISLIFLLKSNENIDKTLQILKSNSVEATFFINKTWINNNENKIQEITKNNHVIGNLSNNLDYENKEFIQMAKIINKTTNQINNYCYYTTNINNIKICSKQNHYTIKPNIETKNNPLIEIKNKIEPGNMITLNINNNTEQQLELIIKYIKSKGYKLNNLENHLVEKKEN